MKRTLWLLPVVAALGTGGWWLRGRAAGRSEIKVQVPTARVEQQRLTVTLPVNGALASTEETPVRFEPSGRFSDRRKIVELCDNNGTVKPGDLVFALDTKDLIDQRDQLAKDATNAREALNKAQADAQVELSAQQSDVDAAQEALGLARDQAKAERDSADAQVKFTEGELARLDRELQRDRRLAELHYIPGTELQGTEKRNRDKKFELDKWRLAREDTEKKSAEAIQEKQSALELAQHQFDAAKARNQDTIESARIRLKDTEQRLAEADQQIAECRVVAPKAGVAVIGMRWGGDERRPWRVGDEIWPRSAPVSIYNMAQMEVRCQVGEMDISRVRKGQKAFVLSPTRSGKRYLGRITSVDETVHDAGFMTGTAGKKVFGAFIGLDQTDPTTLRPGMTVDVEIVLDDLQNVVAVPIRAVFRQQGKPFVYRQRGESLRPDSVGAGMAARRAQPRFERVPVTLGTRGDLLVAVRGRLRRGDRVALSPPPVAQMLLAEARR